MAVRPEDLSPNFVNPAYASPQQIASLREYAKQLMTDQPVHHWAQGIGNIARALMGGYEAHQADIQEQQANAGLSQELGEAIRSKDLAKITALAGNPRMGPSHIALLAALLEPRGQNTYGPGATMGQPGPSILGGAGGAAPPVPQGPTPPVSSAQPLAPADMSGEKMPPGQNITSGDVTGIDYGPVQNGPIPTKPVKTVQYLPPELQKAVPTLDYLNKKVQQYKNQEAANSEAVKENSLAVTKGIVAKPKLENLKQMYDISQHLEDSGFGPRLQSAFKQATGVMPPPNATQYEVFDSLFKRLAPDAITAGRIPPALLEQYNQRGPEIWQDKETRNAILHSIAMPIDLDVRAGRIAAKSDPTNPRATQERLYKLRPDQNPLGRPVPDQRHIDLLMKNKDKRQDFEQMFGPNSSDEILGPQ